jgi:hypothetical protein
MQTRLTNGFIDDINGIINDHDPRIQTAVREIENSDFLYNATPSELSAAIRDNRSEMNFLRETMERYGVIQADGRINDDVTNVLGVIAENIEIQREPASHSR